MALQPKVRKHWLAIKESAPATMYLTLTIPFHLRLFLYTVIKRVEDKKKVLATEVVYLQNRAMKDMFVK